MKLASSSFWPRVRGALSRALDAGVTAGIVFLVIATPLAIGSVEPWAYGLMEAVVFLVLAAWAAKAALMGWDVCPVEGSAFRRLAVSLVAFIAWIAFQVVPLPPAVEHWISPSTYQLYANSLPGWPKEQPYRQLLALPPTPGRPGSWLLPTVNEVERGAVVPFALAGSSGTQASSKPPPTDGGKAAAMELESHSGGSAIDLDWRPLSVAPSLTTEALLKFATYTSLFLLVVLYPFGAGRDQRADENFYRRVLGAVLSGGVLVALLSLVQQATWNGRILWVFVPYDWGGARPGGVPRASGPFVNPDHFANYLAMIFPLALSGTIFPTLLSARFPKQSIRLWCGMSALILFTGIVASLSRAGWISTALGLGIFFWLLSMMRDEAKPVLLRRASGKTGRYASASFFALLVLALFLLGPSGRKQVDLRFAETVGKELPNPNRLPIWEASLEVVRDFPLFGVGLAGWPDIFPRYRRAPWSQDLWNAAHNDYLQLAAETGLVGLALLGWAFFAGVETLFRHMAEGTSSRAPLVSALASGLAAALLHELVDFPLQIPANALLFTVFFALALRMSSGEVSQEVAASGRRFRAHAAMAAAAAILIILALHQKRVPYPYDVQSTASPAALRNLILAHPASSRPHLMLVNRLSESLPHAERLRELTAALWLEPINPLARDLYAQALLGEGKSAVALDELRRSVLYSPSLDSHFYLAPRLIPWLSHPERKAIAQGFTVAIARNYPGAVDGLGALYEAEGRLKDEAELYAEAARRATGTPQRCERYLLAAGTAYSQAGDYAEAERVLREAISIKPQDTIAYENLISLVFIRRKDVHSAEVVARRGIARGADSYSLYLALADAASQNGDVKAAETALKRALTVRPAGFDAIWRLGWLCLASNQYAQAAQWFEKATAVRPTSAPAFFNLALAEESDYNYVAADSAYAKAVALDPQNSDFKARYGEFQRKLRASPKHASGSSGLGEAP